MLALWFDQLLVIVDSRVELFYMLLEIQANKRWGRADNGMLVLVIQAEDIDNTHGGIPR